MTEAPPGRGPAGTDGGAVRRRSRSEQREESRRRLLDAAMSCLVSRGYARATTAAIAEAAGLSEGAMFNHFSSKEELLTAVVEDWYVRGITSGLELASATVPGRLTMSQLVDVVFATYDSPESLAIQELYIASRLVPRLREACVMVSETLNRRTLELAGFLFPEFAGNPRFPDIVAMFQATVRGAAMVRAAFGSAEIEQAVRRGLSDALEALAAALRAEAAAGGDG
jgi:AcrR family transcriptional regulator